MRRMAERTRLPYSTYASFENGDSRLHLDTLSRILEVLECDILDVWPVNGWAEACQDVLVATRRQQELRFLELVRLSKAEAAVLFRQVREDEAIETLLAAGASDILIARLRRGLEMNSIGSNGVWLQRDVGCAKFWLYLRAVDPPSHCLGLARSYLEEWGEFFSPGGDARVL